MARPGFLPGDDPRLSSTIDAIRTELGVQGPLLYRYSGMAQQEGGFLACSFWFSKATGRMLREGLGKVHFWLWFIGTNLTFLPMFWLGFHGMPRRIPTYLPSDGFTTENLISSIGAALLGLGAMVFMLNVAESLGRPSVH